MHTKFVDNLFPLGLRVEIKYEVVNKTKYRVLIHSDIYLFFLVCSTDCSTTTNTNYIEFAHTCRGTQIDMRNTKQQQRAGEKKGGTKTGDVYIKLYPELQTSNKQTKNTKDKRESKVKRGKEEKERNIKRTERSSFF